MRGSQMIKWEIIQWEDERYSIRRTIFWLLVGYLDLEDPKYWWPINERLFRCCLSNDLEHVEKRFDNMFKGLDKTNGVYRIQKPKVIKQLTLTKRIIKYLDERFAD